jgi:N-acetylmuramoyl-L-alanine amidase
MFLYSITAYNVNNTKNKTVATVALPVKNKVIVIDAGHGVPDEGAQSSNGTTEAESNLKIALKVQNLLEQSGATVILTRSDENAIYDLDSNTLKQKKISDIHNRVKIGNESSADIFVSIHLNKIPQQQYYGWQCFYKQNDEKSTVLAKSLQQNLNDSIQKRSYHIHIFQ